MGDFPSPYDLLLAFLQPPMRVIAQDLDAAAAAAITLLVFAAILCFFGWLIRTGRIQPSSEMDLLRIW